VNDAEEEVVEPELPICDPHHHVWDREPDDHYLASEYAADITAGGHRIEHTVAVEFKGAYRLSGPEAMSHVGETEHLAGVAALCEAGRFGALRIAAGIVGRADLTQGAAAAEVLEAHIARGGGRFRGVRHAGAWDPGPGLYVGHHDAPEHLYALPAFREGYAKLADNDLSFDAWQYHTQLGDVLDLARAFPQIRIMLNHVGGPAGVGRFQGRQAEVFPVWRAAMAALAACPNVWVKLGGLGVRVCGFGFGFNERARPAGSDELVPVWRPYIETCIDLFGVGRAMFESNFPVDKISCSSRAQWNAFKRIVAGASAEEKAKLFRGNAMAFYRLAA
jgi:L-fuconolactonase